MRRVVYLILLGMVAMPPVLAGECPQLLAHQMRKLHSSETVNLCERYAGRALLIVNTASHCGYTPQFEGLEALYKEYADRGLVVLGFPSDDFRQEADDESKTAEVCFLNYGVTFDMFAPIGVTGAQAHPLFRELAAASAPPRWNFFKYVVDRDGRVLASFPSAISPDSRELREALDRAL